MISASLLNTSTGAQRLVAELADSGYVIVGEVFSESEWSDALNSAEALFDLDEGSRRASIAESPFSPGFSPHGRALAGDSGVPNLLESWTLAIDTPASVPAEGVSEWTRIAALGTSLRRVAAQCLTAVDDELFMADGALAQIVDPPQTILLLDYPVSLLDSAGIAERQSTHVDSSLLTILPRATRPGLLAASRDGSWVGIEAPSNGAIVMAGSALEAVSGGEIQACVHTVDTPESVEAYRRTSIVLFASARADAALDGLKPRAKGSEPLSGASLRDAYFANRFAW